MAFLDNSGDIILDAVLTDTGRLRLAQGDGSFKISKFALGDDEINYANYNKLHPSGSAYYDLEVLQTPLLEAFANNSSNLKSKLVSMNRTNILYMPILQLNKNDKAHNQDPKIQHYPSKTFKRYGAEYGGNGADKLDNKFYIAVDKDTFRFLNQKKVGSSDESGFDSQLEGVIQGFVASTGQVGIDNPGAPGGSLIRVDHGLNSSEVSPGLGLDTDLQETAFIVELDYRLGRVKFDSQDIPAPTNFIDDDNIATYYLSSGFVNPKGANNNILEDPTISNLDSSIPQVFAGPRGSTFHFRIHASQELQQSTYLFNQMGSSEDTDKTSNILGFPSSGSEMDTRVTDKITYYIDSTVRVIGVNTGFRLDIPIRFIKIT